MTSSAPPPIYIAKLFPGGYPPAIGTPAARNRLQGRGAGDGATTNADCVKAAIIPACGLDTVRRKAGSGRAFAARVAGANVALLVSPDPGAGHQLNSCITRFNEKRRPEARAPRVSCRIGLAR